jgi:hypothetical protein
VTTFENGCAKAKKELLTGESAQGREGLALLAQSMLVDRDEDDMKKKLAEAKKKFREVQRAAKTKTRKATSQILQADSAASKTHTSPLAVEQLLPLQQPIMKCAKTHGEDGEVDLNMQYGYQENFTAHDSDVTVDADTRLTIDLDNYHLYRDCTGFDFDIALTRNNYNCKGNIEQYCLRVSEEYFWYPVP